MPTYRLVVEYDGTDFAGFQLQPQVRTVAFELERALGQLFDQRVRISAAGRTDSGVHATGQVISFETEREFPFERLAIALNSILPGDISVRAAEVTDRSFSARFSALERTYVYVVLNSERPSALLRRYAYQYRGDFDLDRLREAASSLLGEHDFRSFCGTLPENGSTVRRIMRIDARRQGDFVMLTFSAEGFLHRMVRALTGTLLEVAAGRREIDSVAEILNARDRQKAGRTAPACGLYLAGVRYADFDSYCVPPICNAALR